MPAAVAIAVVSWNTRDLLGACLESLRTDHEAGRAEVWVVDNASADGSADLVRDRFPWVMLIASSRNLGYGPAVNLVARRTGAPWLAAANSDLVFEPGALATLLETGRRLPGAGALAPQLIDRTGRIQHSVHAFPTLRTSAAFNLDAHRLVPGLGDRLCLEGRWDPGRERDVDWAHGALLVVRRAAWEQVGGFDDDMWFYAEDLDLCWRLRGAGWAVRYVPGARVRHAGSASAAAAWGDARLERSQGAAYAWMRRRRGGARTCAFAALNVAAPAVRAAALGVAARTGLAAGSRERRAMLRRWSRAHRAGLRIGAGGPA